MFKWYKKIETLSAKAFLPTLLVAAEEQICTSSYYWDNSSRPDKPHIIFQYTLSGCGCFNDGKNKRLIPAGTGFLAKVPSNTKYFYPKNESKQWHFFFCCFRGQSAELLYKNIRDCGGEVFKLSKNSKTIHKLLSLRELNNININAPFGASLIFELLTAIATAGDDNDDSGEANTLINRASKFIKKNLSKGINVSDAAEAVSVSREHLTRTFTAKLGISAHEYIENERVSRACNMLKTTSLSCKQIADCCGFGSANSFGRVFKRKIAITPKEYKEQPHTVILH